MNADTSNAANSMEMPFEGIAAYWLSLKKIMGPKFQPKALAEEAARTEEPFIRYLLDLLLSDLPDEKILRLGTLRRQKVLNDISLRMALMREALLGISMNENPRKTLVRLAAAVPEPPLSEERLTLSVMEMIKRATTEKKKYTISIHVHLPPDQLVLKLMFYVFMARREGVAELLTYAEQSNAEYFRTGLTMVSDGFDRSFIKSCMETAGQAFIQMSRRKLLMATDLALMLRTKMSYEDMFTATRAYL